MIFDLCPLQLWSIGIVEVESLKATHWVYCKKKGSCFPFPSLEGIIKLFPARENLVSDIPAGDGKTSNLFYSVHLLAHPFNTR
jgi:hypothetical protein